MDVCHILELIYETIFYILEKMDCSIIYLEKGEENYLEEENLEDLEKGEEKKIINIIKVLESSEEFDDWENI